MSNGYTWTRVGVELRTDNKPKEGIRSLDYFYPASKSNFGRGWRIFVYPRYEEYDRVKYNENLGLWIKEWSIEIPCPCKGVSGFLGTETWIPVHKNNIVVCCNKCNKPRVYVRGLCSLEWEMVICGDLMAERVGA